MARNISNTHATVPKLSRFELLFWVNDTLKSEFRQIEEIRTGAAYCQLLDMLFPGCIPLKKVKFYTNLEHEFHQNYKLLQAAFQKYRINQSIPIASLSSGNYLDNFEFLQWFKKFYDINDKHRPYNPVEARGGIPLGYGIASQVKRRTMPGKTTPRAGYSAPPVPPIDTSEAFRPRQPPLSQRSLMSTNQFSKWSQQRSRSTSRSGYSFPINSEGLATTRSEILNTPRSEVSTIVCDQFLGTPRSKISATTHSQLSSSIRSQAASTPRSTVSGTVAAEVPFFLPSEMSNTPRSVVSSAQGSQVSSNRRSRLWNTARSYRSSAARSEVSNTARSQSSTRSRGSGYSGFSGISRLTGLSAVSGRTMCNPENVSISPEEGDRVLPSSGDSDVMDLCAADGVPFYFDKIMQIWTYCQDQLANNDNLDKDKIVSDIKEIMYSHASGYIPADKVPFIHK